jgi:signal transduction histidine kinase
VAAEYACRLMPATARRAYRGPVRSRLADLGVSVIPFGLGLWGPGGANRVGWPLILCAAFSVPLYWRRSCPLAVLLATYAVGLVQVAVVVHEGINPRTLPGFYDLGIVIAIYSAVAYGSRPARLVAVAGGIGGASAGALAWLGRLSTPNLLTGVTMLFAPVLIAWALGTAAQTRRAYLAGLVERAGRLEREREALARVAVADERERIAREIHDIVAHSVSVMVVQSDGAEAALDQQNLEEVRKAIAAIGRTGRDALTELRLLLGVLRGGGGLEAPQPGTGQLEDLISSVPLPVRLRVDGPPRELSQGLALAAFRIVQEALTNTVRHAGPGASADVRLNYQPGALEVEVTDDGAATTALVPPPAAGHGLIGMRERAAMFGGTLTAGPQPAGGYCVRAQLPWT